MSKEQTSTIDEKYQNVSVLINDDKSSQDLFYNEDEGYDYDDSANYSTNYSDEHNPRGLRRPNKSEMKSLRRIIGPIKWSVVLICFVEFAERASYYSVTGILSNFIQRPLPKDSPHGWGAPKNTSGDENAGALGQGLQTTNALTNLLTFLAYVIPIFTGYVADSSIGRWKAIQWGVLFGGISHLLFIIAAAPTLIANGKAGLAICIIAIITLALGTGFIKPNLLPLMLDQYPEDYDMVKVLPSGEKVILDRNKALERMTLVFYWAINIGAFFQLATSYCERRVGFWLAFFVPMILYLLMPLFLWWVKPKLRFETPRGSVLNNSVKVFTIVFQGNFVKRLINGTFWEYAKPSNMKERGLEYFNSKKQSPITWNDQFVMDVQQTIDACKLFAYYVVFNLADSGLGSVENSLIGAMSTNGVPNDLFNNFNPLTIIVLIPILDNIIYPFFRKHHIDFKPVYRIAFGFVVCAMSQVAGAVLQHQVYQKSPCGANGATVCGENGTVADITAWKASSLYILGAAGECFAMTTGYELAYTRSPPHMRSLLSALFLLNSAIAAAISEAITPALKDPYLVWVFAAIGIATVVCAAGLLWQFWNLDKVMLEEANEREYLDRKQAKEVLKETEEAVDNNLQAITSVKSNLQAR
ncbi:unnamed protein product [Candida verbasci]|uniref:Peptide transporter PTR2 n=1 Tax=Candida verbasci TaxID=1227364 RepID=A0A9W4X8C8_9ASCO|nr:unnamed protein product [Candida verbasci]